MTASAKRPKKPIHPVVRNLIRALAEAAAVQDHKAELEKRAEARKPAKE